MTVIVGLEAACEKGVVIGADRASVNGIKNLAEHIKYLGKRKEDLPYFLEFLKINNIDKVILKPCRKIEVSKDEKSLIAHTGINNEALKRAVSLLLNPDEFLQDTDFLKRLLFPFSIPEELQGETLRSYLSSFNLKQRILDTYIPEIRRIFDLAAVEEHELRFNEFRRAYWDRNYNPAFSEFLFSTLFGEDDKATPMLLDVSLTGAVYRREYWANGSGQSYALDYMRKRLKTSPGFFGDESKIKRAVSIDEAVDIVKGAVEYANKRNQFCKGLDYAIATPDGVETHFSDEDITAEIDLRQLISTRISELRREQRLLKKAETRYKN